MYTITIFWSSLKSLTNFKDIFDLKGLNLDQRGPKMGGLDFFWTVNQNFPKEDHSNSFYTKNQQNSMSRLVDIT